MIYTYTYIYLRTYHYIMCLYVYNLRGKAYAVKVVDMESSQAKAMQARGHRSSSFKGIDIATL